MFERIKAAQRPNLNAPVNDPSNKQLAKKNNEGDVLNDKKNETTYLQKKSGQHWLQKKFEAKSVENSQGAHKVHAHKNNPSIHFTDDADIVSFESGPSDAVADQTTKSKLKKDALASKKFIEELTRCKDKQAFCTALDKGSPEQLLAAHLELDMGHTAFCKKNINDFKGGLRAPLAHKLKTIDFTTFEGQRFHVFLALRREQQEWKLALGKGGQGGRESDLTHKAICVKASTEELKRLKQELERVLPANVPVHHKDPLFKFKQKIITELASREKQVQEEKDDDENLEQQNAYIQQPVFIKMGPPEHNS